MSVWQMYRLVIYYYTIPVIEGYSQQKQMYDVDVG